MRTIEVKLEDVEAIHREHPWTFSIPRREVREALPLGCHVKLVFVVPDTIESEFGAERMWCEVTARHGDRYTATLLNQPQAPGWLLPGDEVRFQARHVAAIALDDEPNMEPLIGCSLAVLRDGAQPTRLLRVEPTGPYDSGWRIFADDGDHRVRSATSDSLFRAWQVLDSVVDGRESGLWTWDVDALEYRRAAELDAAIMAAAGRGLGRVHQPAPSAQLDCVISRRALAQAPSSAQWTTPEDDRPEDSGWWFFVGDESDAYMDDHQNHMVVPLARVLHLYPFVERVVGETEEIVWRWDDTLGDWTEDG